MAAIVAAAVVAATAERGVEHGAVIDVEAVVGAGTGTEDGAVEIDIEVGSADTGAVAEAGGTALEAVIGVVAVKNVQGIAVLGGVTHAAGVAVLDTKKQAQSGSLNQIYLQKNEMHGLCSVCSWLRAFVHETWKTSSQLLAKFVM